MPLTAQNVSTKYTPRMRRPGSGPTVRSFGRVLYVGVVLALVVAVGTSPALRSRLWGSGSQHGVVATSSSGVPAVVLPTPLSNAVQVSCVSWPIDNSPGCVHAALAQVNFARGAEGVGPMMLPAGWGELSVDKQLFWVINAERAGRGLSPYRGLSHQLDSLAQGGADSSGDPGLPSGAWGTGIWAGGYNNVLLADYDWMYNDGSPGPNVDCPQSGVSGCWGHRGGILLACASCSMGVGWVGGGTSSLAAEFVGGWQGPLYYRAGR